MKLLDELPAGLATSDFAAHSDSLVDQLDLVLDLLGSSVEEDPLQNYSSLLLATEDDKMAWGLGAEGQQACEDDRGNTTNGNHVPPSMGYMGERSSDAVRDDLLLC